jgi:hypothetical protein
MSETDRREFLGVTAASAAALALSRVSLATDALGDVRAEVLRRHAEGVERLRAWVRQPSIAAENRGMREGSEALVQMARDAGFQAVTSVPTDGQPGVFGTLDAGAKRTVGVYFM